MLELAAWNLRRRPNDQFALLADLYNGDPSGAGFTGLSKILDPAGLNFRIRDPPLLLREVQIKTRPHRGDFLRFQLLGLAIAVPVTSGHVFFHDGPVPINPTPTVDDNSAAAANKQRWRLPGFGRD